MLGAKSLIWWSNLTFEWNDLTFCWSDLTVILTLDPNKGIIGQKFLDFFVLFFFSTLTLRVFGALTCVDIVHSLILQSSRYFWLFDNNKTVYPFPITKGIRLDRSMVRLLQVRSLHTEVRSLHSKVSSLHQISYFAPYISYFAPCRNLIH